MAVDLEGAAVAATDAAGARALRLLRLARAAADALDDVEADCFERDAEAQRAFAEAPQAVLETLARHVLACDRVSHADTEALSRALDEITSRSGRPRRAVMGELDPRQGAPAW
jgi:hypothetical protein